MTTTVTAEHTCMTASEAACANLPEKTKMVDISYSRDGGLDEQQIRWLIEGNFDKLYESFESWESDHRFETAEQYLMEACGVDGYYHAGIYEIPDDEDPAHVWYRAVHDEPWGFEEFRAECDERDESDLLADLIRQTSDPMIRYSVGHEVTPNSWSMDDDEVRAEMDGIAEALGIILHDSRNFLKLHALVAEASYGGTLTILHRTPLEDVVKMRDGGSIVFTDPQVLVYDGFNGSGSMEQITGTITVQVEPETETDYGSMRLDAGRYSWSDDIAGLVHSCADTPATFNPKEKDET